MELEHSNRNEPIIVVCSNENPWFGKTKEVKSEEIYFSGKCPRRLRKI